MIRLSADSDVPIPGQRFALQIFLLNPRIALLFLRTPVALGGKKAPRRLNITTTNMLDSKCQSGLSTMASSKYSVTLKPGVGVVQGN